MTSLTLLMSDRLLALRDCSDFSDWRRRPCSLNHPNPSRARTLPGRWGFRNLKWMVGTGPSGVNDFNDLLCGHLRIEAEDASCVAYVATLSDSRGNCPTVRGWPASMGIPADGWPWPAKGDVPPWVDGEALVRTDWNVSTGRRCAIRTGNPAGFRVF